MGIRVLFKNVRKTFMNKKFQLLAISLIIFFSSMIYTIMFLATDSIKTPMESMMKNNNAEDFSMETVDLILPDEFEYLPDDIIYSSFNFSLTELASIDEESYNEIIYSRIDEIKSEYEDVFFELEERRYKDISFGEGYKLRAYINNGNINKTYLEEGEIPVKDNEIALNQTLVMKNDLSIGDNIKINDKDYEITGYILYPDFNLPISNGELLINPSKMGIALFSEDEFKSIEGIEGFYLSGIFNDCNENEFKANCIDEFMDNPIDIVSSITLTKNQMRSGAIYEEIRGGQATTLGLSLIIALIAVIMVGIITYRILKSEKNAIGIMKAMGYKNYEIAMPYINLLSIISAPALILGYLVGTKFAYNMKQLYLDFYMLPNGPIETNIGVMLTAVLVPFIFVLGLSYVVIYRMLRKKALILLNVEEKTKATRLNKLVNKLLRKSKATTKFKYTYLTQSLGKFLVFVIGIFFASTLIIMGTMMYGFSDKMINDYYNSKDYEYEAYLDYTKKAPVLRDEDEKFLDVNLYYEDNLIQAKGIEYDNDIFKLYNKKGENITELLKEGVVINNAMALKYDLEVNDVIELEGTNKTKDFEVVEIADNSTSATLYANISQLSLMQFENDDVYIGIYSNIIPSDDYKVVLNKSDILSQSEVMQKFVNVAVYGLIVVALILAILILYILTTLTVEDNIYSISLLKVIGFNRNEVKSMILNSYLTYCIIAYLLSIPITKMMMELMTWYLSHEFNMYMPMEFNLIGALVGFALIIGMYLVGTINANRKINRISLQEVLKAYNE